MKRFFILAFLLGMFGFFGYSLWKNQKAVQEILSPISNSDNLFSIINAPKDSAVGNIASLSGTVSWQSRISSQLMIIKKPIEIQQGEGLQTGKDGKVTVLFENYGAADLSPNSNLEFIQTLPYNFVFNQTDGTIGYQQIGRTPITIRALHAVFKIDSGVISMNVDKDNQKVDMIVKKGQATVGFNDVDFVSQVISVKSGREMIYDDQTRITTVD